MEEYKFCSLCNAHFEADAERDSRRKGGRNVVRVVMRYNCQLIDKECPDGFVCGHVYHESCINNICEGGARGTCFWCKKEPLKKPIIIEDINLLKVHETQLRGSAQHISYILQYPAPKGFTRPTPDASARVAASSPTVVSSQTRAQSSIEAQNTVPMASKPRGSGKHKRSGFGVVDKTIVLYSNTPMATGDTIDTVDQQVEMGGCSTQHNTLSMGAALGGSTQHEENHESVDGGLQAFDSAICPTGDWTLRLFNAFNFVPVSTGTTAAAVLSGPTAAVGTDEAAADDKFAERSYNGKRPIEDTPHQFAIVRYEGPTNNIVRCLRDRHTTRVGLDQQSFARLCSLVGNLFSEKRAGYNIGVNDEENRKDSVRYLVAYLIKQHRIMKFMNAENDQIIQLKSNNDVDPDAEAALQGMYDFMSEVLKRVVIMWYDKDSMTYCIDMAYSVKTQMLQKCIYSLAKTYGYQVFIKCLDAKSYASVTHFVVEGIRAFREATCRFLDPHDDDETLAKEKVFCHMITAEGVNSNYPKFRPTLIYHKRDEDNSLEVEVKMKRMDINGSIWENHMMYFYPDVAAGDGAVDIAWNALGHTQENITPNVYPAANELREILAKVVTQFNYHQNKKCNQSHLNSEFTQKALQKAETLLDIIKKSIAAYESAGAATADKSLVSFSALSDTHAGDFDPHVLLQGDAMTDDAGCSAGDAMADGAGGLVGDAIFNVCTAYLRESTTLAAGETVETTDPLQTSGTTSSSQEQTEWMKYIEELATTGRKMKVQIGFTKDDLRGFSLIADFLHDFLHKLRLYLGLYVKVRRGEQLIIQSGILHGTGLLTEEFTRKAAKIYAKRIDHPLHTTLFDMEDVSDFTNRILEGNRGTEEWLLHTCNTLGTFDAVDSPISTHQSYAT